MALPMQKEKDINSQFDPMRRRAQQAESVNLQGQQDQLARNQARLGGGPNGAFIKQGQVAADQSAQRLQSANEGIDAQQTAALNQARDAQEGRDFQTSERLGSQGFASGERLAGQKYGTSERIAGQGFAAEQSAIARRAGELEAQKGRDQQGHQFDLSRGDANAQNKFENEFNAKTGAATLVSNLLTSGKFDRTQIEAIFKDLNLPGLGLENYFNAVPDVAAKAGNADATQAAYAGKEYGQNRNLNGQQQYWDGRKWVNFGAKVGA